MSEEFKSTINASNMSAQDMFTKILAERLQSGALERVIGEQVDLLIESTAEVVFRSHGELGKAMQEKLRNSIMPKMEKVVDLPVYHDFVSNRIKLAAENFYNEKLQAALDKELEEIMREVPEQLNLSWIVGKVLEIANADGERSKGEITLEIYERYGNCLSIFLDEEPCVSRDECDYNIYLKKRGDGSFGIISLIIDGKNAGDRVMLGRVHSLNKVLLNAYLTKSKIYLDKGVNPCNYETGWDF